MTAPAHATAEQMVNAQKEFASLLANSLSEVGTEVESIDLLDSLARLGLEIHPISDLYGATTSTAYFQLVGVPAK